MLPDARIAFFFRLRATSETLAMNNGQNTGLGDEPWVSCKKESTSVTRRYY
jgi:hypothetical protein